MSIRVIIVLAVLTAGCSAPRRATVTHDQGAAEQPATISVLIVGEVYRPERYSLPGGVRILDAVSRAGGFKDSAFTRGVRVKRRDGRTYINDLRRVATGSEGDPVLHDGDVVIVPYWSRPML